MRRYCLIFLILCLSGLTACVSKEKNIPLKSQTPRPSWVDVLPKEQGFLFAVGSAQMDGDSYAGMQQAQIAAKVNLLSQIRVKISGDTQIHIQVKGDEKSLSSTTEKVVEMQIRSQLEAMEMRGLEMRETWADTGGNEAWALVRFNREEAENWYLFSLKQMETKLLGIRAESLDTLDLIFATLSDLEVRQDDIDKLSFLGVEHKAKRDESFVALQEKAHDRLGTWIARMDPKDRDYGKAMEWSEKAAEKGHIVSQYYIGRSYSKGEGGLEKDGKKAVYWYEKAAIQGHAGAQYGLGNCYASGYGTEKNYDKGLYW